MSSPTDPSTARPTAEHSSGDEHSFVLLRAEVLAALRQHAPDLAERWEKQARSVAFFELASEARSLELESTSTTAQELIDVLINALAVDEEESEETITQGHRFGSESFMRGVSLHHTMKALDLLFAMMLYTVELSLESATTQHPASTASGVRLARQLHRRAALLSLAATRGYAQAYSEALRERFRLLRHDLRNPLGTITSVLALMDDDTIPLEARANPSFRAMAKRNARTLEQMIGDQLSDAAALLPVVASQDISLRTLACAVRRELRAEAGQRGVSVLVGPVAPEGVLDASGLELLLHGALYAALQECDEGEQLHIEFGDQSADRVTIALSCASGRQPIQNASALERLTALAERIGVSMHAQDQIVLSVSIRDKVSARAEGNEREQSIPRDPVGLGDEPRNDVRSTRQGNHGEASAH